VLKSSLDLRYGASLTLRSADGLCNFTLLYTAAREYTQRRSVTHNHPCTIDRFRLLSSSQPPTLNVNITKRPSHRTHQTPDLDRPAINPDIYIIVQRDVRTGRMIQKRAGAGNGVLAILRIGRLPAGPDAIDHAVVEEEDGVAGVTADGVVAAAVDADVAAAGHALHVELEGGDVRAVLEQRGDGAGVGEGLRYVWVQVAFQAARVVGRVVGVEGRAGEGGRAEVHAHVFEGAGCDAAAAGAGREVDVRVGWQGERDARVRDGGAVAGHGGVGAVEDGGLRRVLRVEGPVPISVGDVSGRWMEDRKNRVGRCVRLVALVTAFFSEGLLV